MTIGSHSFLWTLGYDTEVVALFQERERIYVPAVEDGGDRAVYGYFSEARQLRQRLQVKGFNAARAMDDVGAGIKLLRDEKASKRAPGEPADLGDWAPADVDELLAVLRLTISRQGDPSMDEVRREIAISSYVEALWGHVSTPSLLRLILEAAPGELRVGHDLHEMVGCCVDLDPHEQWAASARADQLSATSVDAPLIVLTEGSSDSHLLRLAMSVTHPHLIGFVRFIDFASDAGAEGSVSALARTVSAFIAAGVANRFVAIADNDTEAHAALQRLKSGKLPSKCRVTHYPDLELLASYPTIEPHTGNVVLADINGRAGSLEMYLGRDALTIDGSLAPVQWGQVHPLLQRHHGVLPGHVKKKVQRAFKDKVKRALNCAAQTDDDWAGTNAIMNHIVDAFG